MRGWTVALVLAGCSFSRTNGERPPVDGADPDGPALDTPTADCFGAACRHRTIRVDHTKVTGGPHAQFPLYVDLSDADLLNAAPSGFDIVFTLDGTTKLPYERESFVQDRLIAWVALPSLRADQDTVLRVYYGDKTATIDQQQRSAVWDAGYQGVWHLAQTTGGTNAILDSTTHANAGTNEGGVTLGVDGRLGPAAQFGGVDGRIHVKQSASLDGTAGIATLEAWANFTNPGNGQFQRLLLGSNSLTGDNTGVEWATDPGGSYYYYPANAGGANFDEVATPFVAGVWHHVALTQKFDTRTVVMYIDGRAAALTFEQVPQNWVNLANLGDWFWGGKPPRNQFTGKLDELRVSNVVRAADWIATEFANQSSPGTFYSVQ